MSQPVSTRSHPQNLNAGNHLQDLFKQTSNSNKQYWESYSRVGGPGMDTQIRSVMPRFPEAALQRPKAPLFP
eukprot:2873887-Pyramimonas_sp.AAC.1